MKKLLVISGIIILFVGIIGAVVYFRTKKSTMSAEQSNIALPPSPIKENLQQTRFFHDQDRDGIQDTKEKELGTSDRNFDSDGDALTDTDEINTYKTDPTNSDTDADGFWDGMEIIRGYNPLGEGR